VRLQSAAVSGFDPRSADETLRQSLFYAALERSMPICKREWNAITTDRIGRD
jgi:hypothetical protein